MTLLLDTHIILWLHAEPDRLSKEIGLRIVSQNLYLSIASVWEFAIKLKTEKLTIDRPLDEFIAMIIARFKVILLNVELPHIYHTQQLPLHHRDPLTDC